MTKKVKNVFGGGKSKWTEGTNGVKRTNAKNSKPKLWANTASGNNMTSRTNKGPLTGPIGGNHGPMVPAGRN